MIISLEPENKKFKNPLWRFRLLSRMYRTPQILFHMKELGTLSIYHENAK